jgi:hypothetical protein
MLRVTRLAIVLLLALPLRAQDTPPSDGNSPPAGQEQAPAQTPAPEEPSAPRGPIDFSTAKENYPGIVEAYISEHSENNAMPFKDKAKRAWKLELQSVDIKTFKKLKENLYAACALMRDGADALDMDFTVDFSGDHWHVSSVNLHKVNGKPRFNYKSGRRVAVK